ncbi:uncharacterized protein LOC130961040 isoform X1 [Arachis stenosperma]|uniref:uncharacterized protein LOC130961040 isoform X1 n=1 Tax=Arachis stenosperma TaxID=217475 RepID=UPI0025AC23C8|nr:uncharacterized protein LOC130961040 isoform X1 [Arachis stenosperma]
MEPLEIDLVDIPDTPDRLTTRPGDQKHVRNPEKREKGFPAADEMKKLSNYIILSPSNAPYPSYNGPFFRKTQTEKTLGLGTAHSIGAEKMERGKTVSSRFPAKSSRHGPRSVLDFTEENENSQQLKPAFSHHGSRDKAVEDKKVTSAGNTSSRVVADSSTAFRDKMLPGPNISQERGKGIALPNDSHPPLNTEKQLALPPQISTTPRVRGQKRLVRNGCISPYNIANRANQATIKDNHQTKEVEESHAVDLVSTNPISTINVEDIVAEERGCNRVKGKQVLIHPSSYGLNTGTVRMASSNPATDFEEGHSASNAVRNSLKYSGGQDGWRTTHAHNSIDQHPYDVNGHNLRRSHDVGRFIARQNMNRMDRRDTHSSQSGKDAQGSSSDNAAQATSLTIREIDQLTVTHPATGTLSKRQKKRGSTSGNPGESSSSSHNPVLNSEVVDLSPEPSYTNRFTEGLDDNDNDKARARQVEADERLARELQEQLYHDDIFEGRGQIDEHLALALQQEENLIRTSFDNHQTSNPMFPRANSQPRSRPHQNPSNRRRVPPQVPSSNRMSQLRSQLRSHIANRSRRPAISSRGRRPRFPVDMDLNMRLDILEALEDAVGDFADLGMGNDIFLAQHDFNEHDYEMLLALDEQNHRHTGASSNQINSLPESTIQNDNFTEACAICLETPGKGEIIRHLPCLHKFHKDCIDPWLHRKTSCPVCKSSIT